MAQLETQLSVEALHARAQEARRLVLRTVHTAKAGHVGGPLSAIDVLTTLYFDVLRVDPARPEWEDRDRFVLSKGHSALGLYAVLALRGFLPTSELATFDQLDSRLQGHPDMTRLPGLEMSTGSLGQGLSAAVGMALGARLTGRSFRTYAMIGDGEAQEGQIWEAAMVAARYGLDNLVGILDWNGLQQYGWRRSGNAPEAALEAPRAKFEAFGWHVVEIDGHDHPAIRAAFAEAARTAGKPTMIVARTTKGKGVSFMEGDPDWHAKVPTDAELAAALAELEG